MLQHIRDEYSPARVYTHRAGECTETGGGVDGGVVAGIEIHTRSACRRYILRIQQKALYVCRLDGDWVMLWSCGLVLMIIYLRGSLLRTPTTLRGDALTHTLTHAGRQDDSATRLSVNSSMSFVHLLSSAGRR